ncbi:MAG: T9SS type A sorting domain-containing protein [Bacteroidia bacterium]|nr:T9SS type A sorting domain-containing protein [Bacteroidia bacterium]
MDDFNFLKTTSPYISLIVLLLFSFFAKSTNAQAVSVASFSPVSQIAGKTIAVTGSNFASTGMTVTVGGTSASYSLSSSSLIVVTIPTGAQSGSISVSRSGFTTGSKSGFIFIETIDRMITDYNGYWSSTIQSNNSTLPDLSHNLLAFKFGSTLYSTGVSDTVLSNRSITYTSGLWNAFPVNTLTGSGTDAVLLWASKNDGTLTQQLNPQKKIKDVLIDGKRGLDMGTGIANFDAEIEFTVTNIDPNKISDSEPDILVTQVASPTQGIYDRFYFVDASNNRVGDEVTAIAYDIPILGEYYLDLWNLNSASNSLISNTDAVSSTVFNNGLNSTREMRLFAYKLSDFGLTSSNYSSAVKLVFKPGGVADYSFVAYNANTFVIPTADISQQPVSDIECYNSGNTVTFSVSATNPTSVGANGGTITYQWKKNGTNISGATSSTYSISNPVASDNGAYTCEVTNNYGSILTDPAYLNIYIIAHPQATSTCINSAATLSTSAGGNYPTYQWYSNTTASNSGGTAISGATSSTYSPPVSTAGTYYYYCKVAAPSSGLGCTIDVTSDVATFIVSPTTVAGSLSGTTTVCYGTNSTTLTLTGQTGDVVNWESSASSNFSSKTTIANTTNTLTAQNLTSSTYYRPVVKSGACAALSPTSSLITVNTTYTWEGDVSTSFGNASNWVQGCVPHSGADISFRTTSAPDRICELDQARTLRNITIAGSSATHIFDLNNQTLSLSGSLTLSSANIDARDASSTLRFSGSTAQTLPSGSLVNNEIARLTINNSAGVSLGGTTNLTRLLTLVTGTLTTSGRLTFKSTADYTAQLATVPASGTSISGNVTVEKYVPAKRAFRLLSPTVTTTTSINANWQEGGSTYLDNPNPGYGTHITGSLTGANGLDATLTGNPSLYTFNNATQSWSSVLNTTTPTLAAGTPYRLMIRGGRTVDIYQSDNNPTPTNTTLRATGSILTGSYAVNNLSSTPGADNFIGNPYQCAVDLSQIITSSVANLNSTYVYMWDPFLNTRGAYATIDLGNSSTSPSASTATKYLQPGQAFFVKTSASATGTPSFSFTEASKYTGGTFSTTNLWEIPNRVFDMIDITLINRDSQVIADGTQIRFSPGFSDEVSDLDSRKVMNLDENLSIYNDGNLLSIDSRSAAKNSDYIQLFLDRYRAKNYTLRIKASELPGFELQLRDKYTNTLTVLTKNQETEYSFSISSDLESKRIDRFALEMNFPNEVKLNTQEISVDEITVFPNPLKGNSLQIIGLSLNSEIDLELYDLQGRLIEEPNLNSAENHITIGSHLPDGIYVLTIHTDSGSKSILIKKED